MATSNFERMKYGMPLVCGGFAEDADYDMPGIEIDWELAESLARKISSKFTFHKVVIKSGYYEGLQFWVDEIYSGYFDLDESSEYCVTEEDSQYYFDMSRSQALKAAEKEKKQIAKMLENLTEYGFEIWEVIGGYSNEATVYMARA